MSGQGPTVLLAEDEPMLLALFGAALRAEGFTVLAAADGVEALALAEAHAGPIELLVSDVRMPRMEGPELAARLRALRPGIKVLLVSGSDTAAPGGDAALAKPFLPAELRAKVREMLGG